MATWVTICPLLPNPFLHYLNFIFLANKTKSESVQTANFKDYLTVENEVNAAYKKLKIILIGKVSLTLKTFFKMGGNWVRLVHSLNFHRIV